MKAKNTALNQLPELTQEEEVDVKTMLFNYFRHWKVIAACVLSALIIAYLFSKMMLPVYKISGSVLVADESNSLGTDIFESAGILQPKSNIENEIGILTSYALTEQVVEDLKLNTAYYEDGVIRKIPKYGKIPFEITADWDTQQLVGGMFKIEVISNKEFELSIDDDGFLIFNPEDPYFKSEVEEELLGIVGVHQFGEEISGPYFDFKVNNIAAEEGDQMYFKFADTHSQVLKFQKNIDVAPANKMASILLINMETPVRKLGEDYINKLMELYLQRELKEKNKATANTLTFIDNQLNGITDSLTYFENRLQEYRSQNQVFNLSEEGVMIFERLQDYEKKRSEIELQLNYYETLREYLLGDNPEGLVAPSIVGNTDPLLNSLVIKLSELQTERIRLEASYSKDTPAIQQIKNQIESTQKSVLENTKSAIHNTENSLEEIQSRIDKVEWEINSLPETERNLLGIQRKFSVNENIYLYLLQKRAESQIVLASNTPKNSILDLARAAEKPVAPKTKINLVIGLFLGLFLPIGVIFVRGFLNNKIEDPKELEDQLNVPLISLVGRNPIKEAGALTVMNKPKSTISESFRSLRADMTFLSPGTDKLTILFTSSISGEGKTFCSINMASVYALMGKKTVLIGLDLRKPKIAEEFGLINDRGISTCLSVGKPWEDVVKPSGFANLDIILSGPVPPNPAELLAQAQFKEMIKDIKSSYDVIILDCAPVGLVSETKELFQLADINIFVFRQNYSPKANIKILNGLIEKGGVQKIYSLFNDVHLDIGDYGYSYGYGYNGNGYGYHEEVKKEASWLGKLAGKK
ncbi:polysaccharide biosynthesis tyrosine autokinase [Echinicola sp. CAU 1574]|uniref:non-specific protein-tyrosine kinase n=1 Tax=Echinicola arenosa TaxID=2774144 RepID=A0ABR9AQ39_9BACT|nr:polysaccharide biosynthesis tyrosine autokinase [Echinicola arenosa]MBD8490903.1 polysaccharide biosynthesis tyrosine autokinase [Echinicola arenosa]